MNKWKKAVISVVIFISFVGIASLGLSNKYVVPIIMYHKVEFSDVKRSDNVNPEIFKDQIYYLKAKGYNVITLDEFIDGIHSGQAFPKKSVVLTFDDGYENNYTNAFPILSQYKIPATFFISPQFVGKDGFLNWQQIYAMRDSGMTYGSHGMTQAYLPEISEEEQDFEIYNSKEVLEKKLGMPIYYFTYPVGGFSEAIKTKIIQAGYKAAFTTNRGFDRYNKDSFEINRIRLSDKDDSDFILWAKLSGYYNLFRKGKNPH